MCSTIFVEEFLNNACRTTPKSHDYIAELLRIRGFLVDSVDSRTLNDFSTKGDIKAYFKYLDCNDVKNVHELFYGDRDGYEVTWVQGLGNKWQKLFASGRIYGEKVDVLALEPFIARFCKSLALIGIHTYYSCDGWHITRDPEQRIPGKGNMIVGFKDWFSMQWFHVLTINDEQLKAFKMPFCFDDEKDRKMTIPFSGISNRMNVYTDINRMAHNIYDNRVYYRDLKKKVIVKLRGVPKNNLPFEDIYKLLENTYLLVV